MGVAKASVPLRRSWRHCMEDETASAPPWRSQWPCKGSRWPPCPREGCGGLARWSQQPSRPPWMPHSDRDDLHAPAEAAQ